MGKYFWPKVAKKVKNSHFDYVHTMRGAIYTYKEIYITIGELIFKS